MALKLTNKTEEELSIDISNGHLEALRKIMTDYGLKGEEETVSFMLSVLAQANGSPIGINGEQLVPAAKLKKE